jgi:hypothetical protein
MTKKIALIEAKSPTGLAGKARARFIRKEMFRLLNLKPLSPSDISPVAGENEKCLATFLPLSRGGVTT